jgi:hypothetical protein
MRSERRRTFSDEVGYDGSDEPQTERRLEQLGTRLQHEAARLAARYPAEPPGRGGMLSQRRWSANAAGVTWLAAAVVLVIAVSPWLVNRWQYRLNPDRPLAGVFPTRSPATDTAGTGRPASAPSIDVAGHTAMVASRVAAAAPEIESPVFLLEVSDPELEALLDLWETHGTESTRLSI